MSKIRLMVTVWLISIIFLVGLSFAGGTVSIKMDSIFIHYRLARRILTLSYLGDAENGTIPSTVIDASMCGIKGWYLYSVETIPGSPAPSPNYDITLVDTDGFDIAGGLLFDRSGSLSELVGLCQAQHGYPIVIENLLVVIDNQEVPSAKGKLILIFIPKLIGEP